MLRAQILLLVPSEVWDIDVEILKLMQRAEMWSGGRDGRYCAFQGENLLSSRLLVRRDHD